MTPKAKAEMILPDIKPLPNLVSRESVEKVKGSGKAGEKKGWKIL
jgi:hypothetical protein